ncbi:hypothetical protein SAMN05192533_11243 [Mesobacillus persicus]|uniref:Uncharacterized protein n=1 Tax=Mesobacillus persicus TaxID=930146 RepID=A0A1H8G1A6_9BACI|nr:hypothetical protein SAMN05192533_11243 [Mesobacillus persicus]
MNFPLNRGLMAKHIEKYPPIMSFTSIVIRFLARTDLFSGFKVK